MIDREIPTVPSPSSKWGCTAACAASSIRVHIAGVAKTSKEPDFIVFAILDSVTVTVAVAV